MIPFRVSGGDTLGDTFGATRTLDSRPPIDCQSPRNAHLLRTGNPGRRRPNMNCSLAGRVTKPLIDPVALH